MSMFKSTYEQVRGPRVPSFTAYSRRIKREFKTLLNSDPDEKIVQHFLEQNPSMVPGSETPGGSTGHWPIHLALISQPPLHGFNGRLPDFMWLSKHSGTWYPAMIEIERPGKLIFTEEGVPRAEFTQARNQLLQWQVWLNEPANQVLFMDHYGIDSWYRQYCDMGRHFILVYGRRSEFTNRPRLSKLRGHLLAGNEYLMSFDRLVPNSTLKNAVTVKPKGNGLFEVIAVPETFGVGPNTASFLPAYLGLKEAIAKNSNISRNRVVFLCERIDYWLNWLNSKKGTSVVSGCFIE